MCVPSDTHARCGDDKQVVKSLIKLFIGIKSLIIRTSWYNYAPAAVEQHDLHSPLNQSVFSSLMN